MDRIAQIAAILMLAGCATAPTVPKTVLVPVPTACLKAADVPALPPLTDEAAILRMDDFAATLTTWRERLELRSFAVKAESLLAGCK